MIEHDFILHQLSEYSDQHNDWPLAEWRLALEDINESPGQHHWLCADPVYIHPDRSEALLLAHEELEITHEEAEQLANLINQHYKDEPWELHVGSTHRWYIKSLQDYELQTRTINSVKGKNIFDYLPSGNDARYWQQCMNELQMLLHTSDINQQREEKGLLQINSLWLWGYGKRASEAGLNWDKIYSDDAVLNGLGIISGCDVARLTDELEDIEDTKGNILVYIQRLEEASQQQDIFTWLEELQYLEKYWFEPLLKKMEELPELLVTLLIDNNMAFQVSRKHMKRWWRSKNRNKLY
ncbi:MAG: hypothetical protein P8Y24_09625 [Gammaproteobacteria bacterium]